MHCGKRDCSRECRRRYFPSAAHNEMRHTVSLLCKRRVRKSHGENLVSPGKLDAGGQLELEQQQL